MKIPSTRSLLQTIESLIKLAHITQMSLIPRRLTHIDLFF
jgi:hypothetical protein